MWTLSPCRIIIADDHELYLDGLQLFLSRQKNYCVIGRAKNGKELVDLALQLRPDIVITDIIMPLMSGIVATKLITENLPDVKCIALSMFNEENQIIKMLEAGAVGYMLKNADKDEVLNALESVSRNNHYYCKSTSSKLAVLLSQKQFNPNLKSQQYLFTEKELEIIRLICEENTTIEISNQLYLSMRTVEGYRTRILEKMQVKSAAGVVKYAIKHGLYNKD
jgi:two-component system, NarL family, response regulator NreC